MRQTILLHIDVRNIVHVISCDSMAANSVRDRNLYEARSLHIYEDGEWLHVQTYEGTWLGGS